MFDILVNVPDIVNWSLPPQKKLDINAFKLKWWIWKQLIFAIWSIFGHFLRHAMPFLSFLCHFHTWKT